MPADDTLLDQNLVDERNEGRKVVRLAGFLDNWGVTVSPPLAFCTQDAQCGADADAHFPDCLVEGQLRETFGF